MVTAVCGVKVLPEAVTAAYVKDFSKAVFEFADSKKGFFARNALQQLLVYPVLIAPAVDAGVRGIRELPLAEALDGLRVHGRRFTGDESSFSCTGGRRSGKRSRTPGSGSRRRASSPSSGPGTGRFLAGQTVSSPPDELAAVVPAAVGIDGAARVSPEPPLVEAPAS